MNTPPGTIWTNNVVALTNDLVFGLCVYTHVGWSPYGHLDDADKRMVQDAVNFDPSCPFLKEL